MSTIKFKRSSVSGKIPLPTDLAYGEMALNYADGVIYYKNTLSNVVSLSSAGITNPYNGAFVLTNLTQSTSTNTGALVVAGGVGIGGNLNVGGAIYQRGVAVPTLGSIISSAMGYNLQ